MPFRSPEDLRGLQGTVGGGADPVANSAPIPPPVYISSGASHPSICPPHSELSAPKRRLHGLLAGSSFNHRLLKQIRTALLTASREQDS